jgi:isochorismate synthase
MTIPAASVVASERSTRVAAFLDAALEGVRDPSSLLVASVPAPEAPLEALLELNPAEDAIVWAARGGPDFAALGAAVSLTASGPERIEELERAGSDLFARLTVVALGDPAPRPRCFGGFSFEPGAARFEPWTAFGDARFVLPRFTYAREGNRAFLSIAVRGEEALAESRRRALVAGAEAILATLGTAAHRKTEPRGVSGPRAVAGREEVSERDYRALVDATRARIRRGDFDKAVVARRTVLTFADPVRVSDLLVELAHSAEHCTRFAFRTRGVTFLGVTPERLVRRAGVSVDTEALAGSGPASRGAELFESSKERDEHELVLREIAKSLSPLCTALDYPSEPEIRALRHLLHLRTPVRGRLAELVHVLALVRRLHPTPAVGGVPTREAVRFIVEHEPAERGWYASPIGWFDGAGDGEFVVGLRSGAFAGNRAHLYAGCGIVEGSDPASEYAETRLKLAALCAALHVAQ